MIPAEAVEAAAIVVEATERAGLPDNEPSWAHYIARAALEAAAPHMLTPTAAERAMTDITALLDEYFSDTSRIVEVDVCMRLARIVGRYDMERIGEGEG